MKLRASRTTLPSLDLPLRRRLLPFLRRLRAELTVPMLLVSHDPIEVQALCDEILVLDRGREIARGEPRAVLRDPRVFPLAEREGYENVLPGRLVDEGRPPREGTSTSRVRLGSSSSSRRGPEHRARPSATRWRSPPERVAVSRPRSGSSSSRAATSRRVSSGGRPGAFSPRA